MQDPRELMNAAIEKWAPLAQDVEEATLPIPIRILTGEAIDLALFIDRYWEPQSVGMRPVPGLKQAPTPGLHQGLAQEITELQLATAQQYARYLLAASSNLPAPMERGEFVLSEIRATLTFLFDDGVEDEADEQLRRFAQAHGQPKSQDALALALETYATFGDQYRARMKGLPEFHEGILDEARALAKQLREHSGLSATQDTMDAQHEALALRNRLATLLLDRMALVRRAASYVFRNHPEIARKAMSSYARARARKARGRAKENGANGHDGAEGAEGVVA